MLLAVSICPSDNSLRKYHLFLHFSLSVSLTGKDTSLLRVYDLTLAKEMLVVLGGSESEGMCFYFFCRSNLVCVFRSLASAFHLQHKRGSWKRLGISGEEVGSDFNLDIWQRDTPDKGKWNRKMDEAEQKRK